MERTSTIRRWMKSQRKTVLVVLAGLVGLGVLGYVLIERSRRTVREIEALNGLARAAYDINTGVAGMRLQFGPLQQVSLLGPQTDDGKLAVLDGVPGLRVLTLTNTRVTDEGLARLARFRDLNCFYFGNIDHTKIIGPAGAKLSTTPLAGGKGLEALKNLPNLQVVQLYGPGTSDDDLKGLVSLKHLVLIDLMNTRATPGGVAELKKALPKCAIRLR
jgi:hypothetical protein